jgi:hypothetical protein
MRVRKNLEDQILQWVLIDRWYIVWSTDQVLEFIQKKTVSFKTPKHLPKESMIIIYGAII